MTSEQVLNEFVAHGNLEILAELTELEGPTLRAIAEALVDEACEDEIDCLVADTFHCLQLQPLAYYPVLPKLINTMLNTIARRTVQSAFDRHRISSANRPQFVAYLFKTGEVSAEFLARVRTGRYKACANDILSSDVWQQFAGCDDDESILAQVDQLLRPQLRLVA